MLGLLACTLVASYLVAALFALARNWELGNHGLRRVSARDTARVVVLALAWPLEESWWRLREYFSQEWEMAVPRWQGVAS
jgi:hypothetical protein